MKKLVSFSIIFLSLISCAENHAITLINPVNLVDTIHKTYLALGDSYTIGEAVADTESFPVQTAMLLVEYNIHINNPDIIATTGWTTTDLLTALDNRPLPNTYSVVTLLIGVNNQYQGKTLDAYSSELTDLINKAVSYAGNIKSHVFVLSIPDYSVTPFAKGSDTAKIAQEIDAFNLANKSVANAAGVHYLDITSVSRNAKNDPTLLAGDGLHPSAIQYKKWSVKLALLMLNEL